MAKARSQHGGLRGLKTWGVSRSRFGDSHVPLLSDLDARLETNPCKGVSNVALAQSSCQLTCVCAARLAPRSKILLAPRNFHIKVHSGRHRSLKILGQTDQRPARRARGYPVGVSECGAGERASGLVAPTEPKQGEERHLNRP
jgi:hypothetical protein